MINKTMLGALLAVSSLAASASASATTIDFSTYPLYTAVSSAPGVNISLYGSGVSGPAVTGSFGTPQLGNSPTGDYPTSTGILFNFTTPVNSLSFTFDNFGQNDVSFEQAFAGVTSVDLQNIGGAGCANGCTVTVAGSNITSFVVDNGFNGSRSWEFGIGSVTFTPGAVPEPATWAMMLVGMGAIGFAMRRRASVAISYA